jgi:hypothetical protein
VTAGAPLHLDALGAQARHAAHHGIEARHVVGDVVQARRPRQHRDAVMPFVAAQKAHEVAEPVADAKAQHIREKPHHGLMVRRVQHDVADAHRHGVERTDVAGRPLRHFTGDAEGQTVRREKAKAIPAERARQLARREDLTATRRQDLGMQHVHVGASGGGQLDDVDPLRGCGPQAYRARLVAARDGKIDEAVVLAGFD